MFESTLFPPAVSLAVISDSVSIESLFQEEQNIVSHAVESRKLAFASGRHCARRALEQLGAAPVPILKDENGQPLWPRGYVGSISHCKGLAAAAAAAEKDCRSIGIDVEPADRSIDEHIIRHVCTSNEQERLEGLEKQVRLKHLLITFSAKESLYKCLYPLVKTYFGFRAASVRINEAQNQVSFRLRKELSPQFTEGTRITGRFEFQKGFLLTGIWLPV